MEAQTKKDPDRAKCWAYHIAYLHAKYDLPVLLVVVRRDRSTAAWAAGPFACTVDPWTTQVTRPFVLGPQSVPERELQGRHTGNDVRARITTCTDLDRLHDCLDRSGTVERAEDLFVEGARTRRPALVGPPTARQGDGPGTEQVPGPSTLRRDYFG